MESQVKSSLKSCIVRNSRLKAEHTSADGPMLRKVLLVIVALFAVSSAWMVTSRPAASLQQCPAQAAASQPAPVFMKTVEIVVDDELDNPAIAEDENIMPARKCDPTEPQLPCSGH